MLAEFGDVTHPAVPDDPEQSDATTFDGPMHNEIPKPNRKKDNSTLWQANYDVKPLREHVLQADAQVLRERSPTASYSFDGAITEWVKVPFNQARYGRNENNNIVPASVTRWPTGSRRLALWARSGSTGMDDGPIHATSRPSTLDRYDFDEDGDFNEPDGFIDHFQIVHAGGDEADGDPVYGVDAIWGHKGHAQIQPSAPAPRAARRSAASTPARAAPPAAAIVNVPDNPTGVWVNDYTVQPENGGLSVFAHEFAHDLGLPDLYDTSGNSGGAENSVGFWSLMAQSRGTLPGDAGIGDRPTPMGAWDKFSLGWLDYDVTRAGRSAHAHDPRRTSPRTPPRSTTARSCCCPTRRSPRVGAPCGECGARYFYSDQGNDLDNTMTREVDGWRSADCGRRLRDRAGLGLRVPRELERRR